MNSFQPCKNTSDAIPLYLPQQLFLKPSARLTISMQPPNMKKLEKSISHWEIMEKLRAMIRPDEFSILKVSKTTPDLIKFDAELDNKTRLDKVISKLNNQTIKLKDIPQQIRLKSAEAKSDFPTRRDWDNFFQESKDMDEMKPGERPDTVHLSNLPRKWFVPYFLVNEDDILPSEKLFFRIFEKFGSIRYVDIPICDPYRNKMKTHISGIKNNSVDDNDLFEGYVQFKDYIGFTNTMNALKGMKLMRKEDEEVFCVDIKVDYDRSKHLSDASIRRREIVRDRLVRKQKEKEEKEKNEIERKAEKEKNDRQSEKDLKTEKEQRRKEREERRKRRILEKLKINSCSEINDKIVKEEKKLLKVQRKLEAIRLVEELFRRIKEKKDEINLNRKLEPNSDELKRLKNKSELEVLSQRQKLNNAIEGRVVLKSILSGKKHSKSELSSSSDSSSLSDSIPDKKDIRGLNNAIHPADMLCEPNWYGYPYPVPSAILYPPMRGGFHSYRNKGPKGPMPGASRGRFFSRGRGFKRRFRGNFHHTNQYPPDIEQEYMKYFSKFFPDHDNRDESGYSHSRSYHKSYSRSRSRSYSRSATRSRSRDSKRKRRRTRSKTRSRSRSRTTSKKSARRSRSKSRFTPSPEKHRRDKSKSSSRSSSAFISPKRLRSARSKSTTPTR